MSLELPNGLRAAQLFRFAYNRFDIVSGTYISIVCCAAIQTRPLSNMVGKRSLSIE